MPIGWTNDAPVPLLEIVSLDDVDVTTESSVVGNAADELGAVAVVLVDATTDESSVGINMGGVSLGKALAAAGDGSGCGNAGVVAMFAFSNAVC